MTYQVMIIEDDPMVAAIDRQYVERNTHFRVSHLFKSGTQALTFLEHHSADLIILDYYTPTMDGLEFVDKLHQMGKSIPIIMVTSANDRAIVHNLFSRGVLDYLVKPFEYPRFQQALERFLTKKQLMNTAPIELAQQDIDQLLQPCTPSPCSPSIHKGMNEATLQLVRSFLQSHAQTYFTSEQIAEQVHLSRITIRRYVNFMLENGELTSSIDYQTGGRPSICYCYAAPFAP